MRRAMPNILAAPALAGLLALPAASGSPALAPLDAIYRISRRSTSTCTRPPSSRRTRRRPRPRSPRACALGYEVTEHVGGYGVVGVLKNGKGPTVLVRADMDALPVEEQTGLPYASKVTAKDDGGADGPRDARLRPRHPHDLA